MVYTTVNQNNKYSVDEPGERKECQMGIDLLIKVLGYEVVFWGSVLAVSFVTQGNVDVFRYFPLYLTISLLLIILPYWRQHNQRHQRQQNK
ncbi:hypothetical protein [Limosilactobacillus ingluviei]|nr:hypothetical protein [Limosilactobacillus ingluviei]